MWKEIIYLNLSHSKYYLSKSITIIGINMIVKNYPDLRVLKLGILFTIKIGIIKLVVGVLLPFLN